MKADDAIKISEQAIANFKETKLDGFLEDIYKKIKIEAFNGENSCLHCVSKVGCVGKRNILIESLKEQGYSVSSTTLAREDYLNISWRTK